MYGHESPLFAVKELERAGTGQLLAGK